jgi:leucyl/phenylalanyl-tRNA--protein transferase
MPVYALGREPRFPDPRHARRDGLLAVGGDLSPERLLAAYSLGIFPWYSEGEPILWWSTDPRLVLVPGEIHVPRRLARLLRRQHFRVTFDTAFGGVIRACAQTPRKQETGTWILPEMVAAYETLHGLGFAHSAEAWLDGALAGGVYGVALGRAFFGESMFYRTPDAGKAAFVVLVEYLARQGFELIDCQMTTAHLLRFGAREVPRALFQKMLERALDGPFARGKWTATPPGAETAETQGKAS